jgi:hypothetical protein
MPPAELLACPDLVKQTIACCYKEALVSKAQMLSAFRSPPILTSC